MTWLEARDYCIARCFFYNCRSSPSSTSTASFPVLGNLLFSSGYIFSGEVTWPRSTLVMSRLSSMVSYRKYFHIYKISSMSNDHWSLSRIKLQLMIIVMLLKIILLFWRLETPHHAFKGFCWLDGLLDRTGKGGRWLLGLGDFTRRGQDGQCLVKIEKLISILVICENYSRC